ncbi:uncharacterized protein LOC110832309 [Zootermopsis nevadensis]|uniref:uncharacterized protein LOC110832309 n=1 Tax=Zootermopsis nevadensis TaxID=136037 RepID=UPI000B8E9991|nr:uncharacterized protein LOC110832309 [Zootermopsis nevadensis]
MERSTIFRHLSALSEDAVVRLYPLLLLFNIADVSVSRTSNTDPRKFLLLIITITLITDGNTVMAVHLDIMRRIKGFTAEVWNIISTPGEEFNADPCSFDRFLAGFADVSALGRKHFLAETLLGSWRQIRCGGFRM